MDGVAENETSEGCPDTGDGPGRPGQPSSPRRGAKYYIHIPQGRDFARLPTGYESLDQAKENFQVVHPVARWCLIGLYEPGRNDPRFVAQGMVRGDAVVWRPLADSPAAKPLPAKRSTPPLREHMTTVLTPRLGFFVAEEVVRHVCAKFQVEDVADERKLGELREFLRLGLLAYMEPNAAEDLASKCADLG